MLFKREWKLVATGTDGNTSLFGVNIFDHPWSRTGETVWVPGLSYEAPVYTVKIRGITRRFAAGERSYGVWNFYLYKW